MGPGPGLGGRRDDHDRLPGAFHALFQRLVPAQCLGPDHEGVGLAISIYQQVDQATANRVGVGALAGIHDDDEDRGRGHRVALGVGVERVDPVVIDRDLLAFGQWRGPHERGSLRSDFSRSAILTPTATARPIGDTRPGAVA